MSNIEKIRKEIERRKKENMYDELPMTIGRYYEDRDLLAFIDSLPEEKPSDDLEEAAEMAARKIYPYEGGMKGLICENSIPIYKAGFIAGAEWQARQLLKGSPLPEDTVLFQKGVEEGKRLMMEEAVGGEIVKDITNKLAVTAKNINLDGFKFGDKVKIIIVKQ